MSLKPTSPVVVPAETARVAKAAFPKGNRYMMLRDTFGEFFTQEAFSQLFSKEGKPAENPARLALVTILQFAEQLSDERMAEAIRSRIDLKYLLALHLEDAGFDPSVLCEFRSRLVAGNTEMLLFESLLERFRDHKLLRQRGRQRTDSTHVLTAVRALNRINCVGQTFRNALNTIATVVPEWFVKHAKAEWIERYGKPFDLEQSVSDAKKEERIALERAVAADGLYLLDAVFSDSAPAWLKEVPAVQTLWHVWLQNFTWDIREKPEAPQGCEGSYTLRFRTDEELPLGRHFINSPFDVEARLSRKRNTYWVGYKAVLSETCEEDLPMLITNVQTTPATTQDFDTVTEVHTHLRSRQLLPEQHLVDMGFISAKLLVESQRDYSIDLVGPARHDQRRQAWEQKGFAAEHFKINWEVRSMICPMGKDSASWTEMTDQRGKELVKVHFSNRDCKICPLKADCTTSSRRTVTIQTRPQHEAMIAARAREKTDEFKQLYAKRAGIEGTISLGTRNFDLRRSRYFGMAKTHLQHLVTASAINLLRVADWLADKPRAQTRTPRFERVLLAAA